MRITIKELPTNTPEAVKSWLFDLLQDGRATTETETNRDTTPKTPYIALKARQAAPTHKTNEAERAAKRWTETEKSQLAKLIDDGKTPAQTALLMRRNENSVKQAAYKLKTEGLIQQNFARKHRSRTTTPNDNTPLGGMLPEVKRLRSLFMKKYISEGVPLGEASRRAWAEVRKAGLFSPQQPKKGTETPKPYPK